MLGNQQSHLEIDAVVTWVDGGDPAHRAKLQAFLGKDAAGPSASFDPTRFGDCGEIEYCIASLLRFAPWLRHIHIVSDAQTPALIAKLRGSALEGRVRVVDHRTIFAGYEQFLPTFSSLGIETMLWRIPGLAERFIYLNDDFQLLRPVAAEDFFRDGGVVLRGKWRAGDRRRLGQGLKAALSRFLRPAGKPAAVSNHTAQQLTAAMIGFHDRYFQVPHCPHPMRRAALADYFARHPEQLAANLVPRLRDARQFLLVGIADHLELKAGTAIIDNRLHTLRIKPASRWWAGLRRQLARADKDARISFGCVQSLDMASPPARRQVLDWLDRRIGRLEDLVGTPGAIEPMPD